MAFRSVVVTGCAGFIGSNVALALSRRGWRVIACDWFEDGEKWRNVADVELSDIVSPPDLISFLHRNQKSVDAIVHLGAISSTTERAVDRLVQNNIRLTIDLWEWCARTGTTFLYASSASVYGDGSHGFDDDWSRDALSRLEPLNAYGWSKLVVDRRISMDVSEGRAAPLHWAGLRFFNVYGPREEHKGTMRSVVSQITPQILADRGVSLFRSHNPKYPDGGQLRDFIHVDDCVGVISWLLDNPGVNGIFNVGTGKARSFKDLALAVYAALQREPNITYIDTPSEIRAKYQYFTEARMERLRAAGYAQDFTSLEEGVAAYVRDWISRYWRGH